MESIAYFFVGAVGILLGMRAISRARSASAVGLMAGGIILTLLGFSFVIGGLWSAGELTGSSSGGSMVTDPVASPTG